jgi:hypothetical protein
MCHSVAKRKLHAAVLDCPDYLLARFGHYQPIVSASTSFGIEIEGFKAVIKLD